MKSFLLILFTLLAVSGKVQADNADPGDASTWRVTPQNYQYSMTITTALVFGNVESRDVSDSIAAFVGNDCRGVASPITYVPEQDRYLAHLIVYSNEPAGEEVSLQMYDHDMDEYIAVVQKVDFAANASYGTPKDPYMSITTYNVQFRVTVSGDPIQGAEVSFGSYGVFESDSQGEVSYTNIRPDDIPFSVDLEGYDRVEGVLSLVDRDLVFTIELEMTTYNVSFNVIDGDVPVENAVVSLEGHGQKYTDNYGRALFEGVAPSDSISYSISHQKYNTLHDSVCVEKDNISEKSILSRALYNTRFQLSFNEEGVEGARIKVIRNTANRVVDFLEPILPDSFKTEGNNTWKVDSMYTMMGKYSIKTGKIYDNQSTILKMKTTMQKGEISFFVKVSSEGGNDYLKFMINGEEAGKWSGNTDWKRVYFPVEKGESELEWIYEKDGSQASGMDAAWIDYLVIPSSGTRETELVTGEDGESVLFNLQPGEFISYLAEADHYASTAGEYTMPYNNVNEEVVMVHLYNLRFVVESGSAWGNNPLNGATIVIKNKETKITDLSGEALFEDVYPDENLTYSLYLDGKMVHEGTVDLSQSDQIVQITVAPEKRITASDFISPNKDNINDYWEIENIEWYASFRVIIFNGAGQEIFNTKEYHLNKWDGTRNGRPVPDGVYYYVMKNENGEIKFKGIINLINE